MLVDFTNEIAQLKSSYASVSNILILVSENPSIDSLSSALALYISLKNSGKTTKIACSSDLTVEMSNLIAVDEVKKELGGKNFVISWDYTDGSIDKVSYNIENNKFNLVIQPRENSTLDISTDKIEFKKAGAFADLIFIVGAPSLSSLGNIYTQEHEMYSKTTIVNIDNNIKNEKYGKINLVSQTYLSICELVASLILELNLKTDADCSTNLLTGIDFTSQNLAAENIRPETLEIAAWCMKNGGKRFLTKKNTTPEPVVKEGISEKKAEEAPSPDWLQPKIFRGSSLL